MAPTNDRLSVSKHAQLHTIHKVKCQSFKWSCCHKFHSPLTLVCGPWNIKHIKHVKEIPCCAGTCLGAHCAVIRKSPGGPHRIQENVTVTVKAPGERWKKYINMLTATRSSVIQQSESRSAVAPGPRLVLVGALVVVLGVRAQLGTASVVNWTWCQLWKAVQVYL